MTKATKALWCSVKRALVGLIGVNEMPLKTAVVGDVVGYRDASGHTSDVVVLGAQKAAPANSGYTLTGGSSGTLATATYSYRVAIVDQGVESPASTAKTVGVTGPTGSVVIDATALIALYPTATQWKLYGRTGGSELLIATTAVGTPTFTDTGAVTPSGATKAADGSIRFRYIGAKTVLTQVKQATTLADTNAYFKR